MQLKLLWEGYTPEQDADPANWKPVFKTKFPGREKRRRGPQIEKPGPASTPAPDPFDTKPIAAASVRQAPKP